MYRKAYAVTAMILAALTSVARAQSFSADLVTLDADGRVAAAKGRIYVGGDRVRIEVPELPEDFFVADLNSQTAFLIRPSRHIFMDAKQSSFLTEVLIRVDPDNPCLRWQVMAGITGASANGGEWHCERLSDEMLDGRPAVKYKTVSPRGAAAVSWIDRELHFLRKTRGDDGGGVQVQAIQEGPQADQLFEIPAGYRKFDPLRLIEHIKQSDVWVAPRN